MVTPADVQAQRVVATPEEIKAQGRALLKQLGSNWTSEARQLVSMAVEAGAKARKTSNGHVILIGNGQTATVSPAGLQRGNRSQMNNAAAVKRLVGAGAQQDLSDEVAEMVGERVAEGETIEQALEALKDYRCELCKPPRQFFNDEALDDHRHQMHVQCSEPGCGQWLKNNQSKGPHVGIAHKGHKPWQSAPSWQEHEKNPRPPRPPKNRPVVVVPPPVERPENAELLEDVLAEADQRDAVAEVRSENAVREELAEARAELAELQKRRPYRGVTVKLVEAEAKLAQIQEIIGGGEQMAELEAKLAAETKRADDAEAKLALMKEAFQGL